jgi:thioredoxin 2
MIVRCSQCGQKNRVSPDRLPDTGKCGACQAPIGAIAEPIDVDTRTFDAVVKNSPLPVLVDFWAPWCGPCVRAAPEVKRAAAQLEGKAIVLKVDTQAHPDVAQRLGIQGIPYFAVFSGGRKVNEQTGLVDSNRLVSLVP